MVNGLIVSDWDFKKRKTLIIAWLFTTLTINLHVRLNLFKYLIYGKFTFG